MVTIGPYSETLASRWLAPITQRQLESPGRQNSAQFTVRNKNNQTFSSKLVLRSKKAKECFVFKQYYKLHEVIDYM